MGDINPNLELHLELIAEAREHRLALLVFPELSRTAIVKVRFELPTLRNADIPLIRELMAGSR